MREQLRRSVARIVIKLHDVGLLGGREGIHRWIFAHVDLCFRINRMYSTSRDRGLRITYVFWRSTDQAIEVGWIYRIRIYEQEISDSEVSQHIVWSGQTV